MSESAILWLFGVIISVQMICLGGLAKFLWDHVVHCKAVGESVAAMAGDIRRILADIGTHDTGIRGTVHRTANEVTALRGEVSLLQRRESQR